MKTISSKEMAHQNGGGGSEKTFFRGEGSEKSGFLEKNSERHFFQKKSGP